MENRDRYLFISADTHAHTSDDVYRSYLDPGFRAEFDEFCGLATRERRDPDTGPVAQLPDTRRNADQDAEGVVGEVVFPDAQPPFYPNGAFLSGPPRSAEYPRRLAGVRALNRWMRDYCAQFPTRRAGVGTVLLNDVDDAIEQATWIAANGLRGGIQLPNITPDVDWIPHLGDPCYDPLWAACQDLDVVVNMHVEGGFPPIGNTPAERVLFLTDAPHSMIRNVVLLVLSGVFDRFPRLRLVISEAPIRILGGLVTVLDTAYAAMREHEVVGTLPVEPGIMLEHAPSDYLRSNVWYTASPPVADDLDTIAATVGFDHMMVGNDYPHSEGAYPYTARILGQVFHEWEPAALHTVLAETPASLYGFDLAALQPEADRVGPPVDDVAGPPTQLPDHPNYALVVNTLSGI